MIKVGQVYRQKEECIPDYRKKIQEPRVFVITNIDMNIISGINTDGVYQRVLGVNWLEKDCELLAEYNTWVEAVSSKEFKEEQDERKVRVGQVYQCIDDDWKLVVTLYSPGDIYFIYENGSTGNYSKKEEFLIGKKLIAEYPTWQEAVNSKEFKE